LLFSRFWIKICLWYFSTNDIPPWLVERSRKARPVSSTRYATVPPEGFKRFARGVGAAFGDILTALPDTFKCLSLRRNIQQALVRFRILHDSGGLSIDR